MKNKYEYNLRTHYAPLKRSKYYNTSNNFYQNKSQDKLNNELKINIKHSNSNCNILYRYKTPNKVTEYRKSKFYDYECNNNQDLNELNKEKLTKSFNRIHPYYFQDRIQLIEKEKLNKKIKERMHAQRAALKQLTIYKINNPSKKELLQKINELSSNPLISHEPKPPLYKRTIDNYYYNDNIIRSKDINIFNKPRKAIEEYYNKCQYQIPSIYESDKTIHTKGKYINPIEVKNKYEKQVKEEIMKQRKKLYQLKENRNDEINKGKIKNKLYNDLDIYIKNNEKQTKLNNEKEIILDNNILNEYNKYIKTHLNDGKKDGYNNIIKNMEKEDLKEKNEKNQEKMREKQILKDWNNMYKKTKLRRKDEKNKEKKMWRNYSETFEINYKNKNNFKTHLQCRKNISKDKIIFG